VSSAYESTRSRFVLASSPDAAMSTTGHYIYIVFGNPNPVNETKLPVSASFAQRNHRQSHRKFTKPWSGLGSSRAVRQMQTKDALPVSPRLRVLKLRVVGFPAKMVARRVSEGRLTTEFFLAYASGYQSAQLQNLRVGLRKCATSKSVSERGRTTGFSLAYATYASGYDRATALPRPMQSVSAIPKHSTMVAGADSGHNEFPTVFDSCS
jgi:hypothetical protein